MSRAPSRAKRSAAARPIPVLAPVITADFPARRISACVASTSPAPRELAWTWEWRKHIGRRGENRGARCEVRGSVARVLLHGPGRVQDLGVRERAQVVELL